MVSKRNTILASPKIDDQLSPSGDFNEVAFPCLDEQFIGKPKKGLSNARDCGSGVRRL
jgi:hypothetical protein